MQSDTTRPRGRFLSVAVSEQTISAERDREREALTIVRDACDRALSLLTPGTTLHRSVTRARWGCCVFLDLSPVQAVSEPAERTS